MARPKKNNADYFPHDCHAQDDEKVVYLESLFGDSGYAWYFKMIECFTRSDNFEMAWSETKCAIMARKFNADLATFSRFIVAATTPEIDAFRLDNGMLFSNGLKKRLNILVEKRERDAERQAERRKPEKDNSLKDDVVAEETSIVAATMPQSKVKESKVKESKDLKEKKDAHAGEADFGNFEMKNPDVDEGEKEEKLPSPGAADPANPDPTNGEIVMKWAKQNRAEILAKFRDVGLIETCETPEAVAIEIKNAIEDFCSFHAGDEAFNSSPVKIFREKYPVWFRKRAEKKSRAPSKTGKQNKPDQAAYTADQCFSFFQSRYGLLAESLSKQQIAKLTHAKNSDELSTWMEGMYNTLKSRNGSGRTGETTLGAVLPAPP